VPVDPAPIRESYGTQGLSREDLADDPFVQFGVWFDGWLALAPYDATAVALATADAHGRPSVRNVLLKGVDHGFVFFTNYDSRKGQELAANPQAALCFSWIQVERQVRVVGPVEKVAPEESDAYFATRPAGSQWGAWASDQSRPIADRAALERRWADAEARHGASVPRPPNWGGYRVVPDELEFWQGRPSRLHDRFRYTRTENGWDITRLMP
jgi:pyridoxamine 5'-phosphate oxidase